MRLLLIHSDYMEYETTKAIKNIAEKIDESLKHQKWDDDVLVAFNAVEKGDADYIMEVVEEAAETILDAAEKVGTNTVFLYPYAHLSSDLAPPAEAIKVEKALHEELTRGYFKLLRAPFGWYKSFKISCKGHPLSELSRQISITGEGIKEKKEKLSQALRAEKEAKSYWYILDPEGDLNEISSEEGAIKGYNFKGKKNLRKFARYEINKSRVGKKEPPHVGLMQKQEIADYEPGSDPGNIRFYPKGRFIKSLLEEYVTKKVIEYGGMEIESPLMYDFKHPSLKEYVERFPARQYKIKSPDKEVFLRFAACFGQFLMLHDATFSYKQLPLKLYEMTRYSFRVEQRGELTGLRRLRAFTMPDCHAFCADIQQAKEEMMVRFELCRRILTDIGFELPEGLELAIRVTRNFYDDNKKFIHDMVRAWGRPAIVEMWNDRFFYFVMKYEWNFVDAQDKASALNTDQIDVENGKRYDITFTDEDGTKKNPLIMHMSPSGAIERVIFAMLEKAYLESLKGKKIMLPYWLSPTQVRLIPVSETHLEYCEKLVGEIPGVRVDVDDTGRTVGKCIRFAEKEWIPFILVIGDKEVSSNELTVRMRKTKEQRSFSLQDFKLLLVEEQGGMPFRPLPLPKHISKRVTFRG
ncbi:MAG: threonine--tRNA ligase [Candidatus Thermoplasmatota archaeon]|nr:threonine--tRNA ligase [Candidatus Thermoplasmatota archaeon]MDP7265024.1 threonine--tRNA ligase [Candidatus Thermoplasmatota archaeon]